MNKIIDELRKIAESAKLIIQQVMESDRGINDKVGKNTLINSNLYNEIEYNVQDIEIIQIFVNHYIDYVEGGRKSGSFPPPNAIIQWASRKGIPTDNQTIYAICMSIYKYGISPRPIFDLVYDRWDDMFEQWADGLFKIMTEELDKFFNE